MNAVGHESSETAGTKWLGKVPSHWQVTRLKNAADYWVSNVDKVPAENEEPVRLCNYTDVYYNEHLRPSPSLMHTTATASEIQKFHLQVGDVVITKDSEEWSDIAVPALVTDTAPDLVCGYHLAIVRPRPSRLYGPFLHRLFQAAGVNTQLQVSASGITRYSLPKSAIGEALIPLPPVDEQRMIADFLDGETAKVGDLIAKKQKLIMLLQHQQEGLVRQIVTGQDLSVPKRYSGYSWLGDVPSHWKVLSLKRIAKRVVVGIAEAATHAYSDHGIPLLRSANIRPNRLDGQQLLKIEPWFANKNKSKTVLGDDLLTVRSGVNYGDTAVVPTSLAGSQCFTLLVTSLKLGNVPRYFSYYLNSGINRDYFGQEAWGAAQANLSVPILQMTPVPVPPPSEQARIVHELDRRLKDIECLRVSLEETERQLRLLRSALISAAVTGQIDVRTYRPQEVTALCQ